MQQPSKHASYWSSSQECFFLCDQRLYLGFTFTGRNLRWTYTTLTKFCDCIAVINYPYFFTANISNKKRWNSVLVKLMKMKKIICHKRKWKESDWPREERMREERAIMSENEILPEREFVFALQILQFYRYGNKPNNTIVNIRLNNFCAKRLFLCCA